MNWHKRIIRNLKFTDRQYNGKKQKAKKTINGRQNTTQKTKDWETRTQLKTEDELRFSDEPHLKLFCRSLFVLLYFFFWPLRCSSMYEFWLPPLVSSNSSYVLRNGNQLLYHFRHLPQPWLILGIVKKKCVVSPRHI